MEGPFILGHGDVTGSVVLTNDFDLYKNTKLALTNLTLAPQDELVAALVTLMTFRLKLV